MNIQILSSPSIEWREILQELQHDIYHLPEYVNLEANRVNAIAKAILIVDDGKIFFLPYLLRKCNDIFPQGTIDSNIFDIVSPYGYPGILLNQKARTTPGFPDAAMNAFKQVLASQEGACSAFLRLHPILNDDFNEIFEPNTFTYNNETISIDLRISAADLWTRTRKGHRSTINKCKRLGFTAKIVPFEEYLNEFISIYEETMRRVSAVGTYLSFDHKYFLEMYKMMGDKIHLCIVELDDEIACAGLYTECCGIVQSTFGGTKDKFVAYSPSSLETDFARYWAKERNNEFLHLGGGVGASKDSVYSFKAGFSETRHHFLTQRLIIEEEKYNYLVQLRAKALDMTPEALSQSSFFPAYRS